MKTFEIHSSTGNYTLFPNQCSVDTSEFGPNAAIGEFDGTNLMDVVVSELESKSWNVPRNYRLDSTEDLNLDKAEKVEVEGGYFYRFKFREGDRLQMFVSTAVTLGECGTYFNGIGRRRNCGHILIAYAQYGNEIVFLCDSAFNDKTDCRFILNALRNSNNVPCTKDSCVGYSLKNLGSVSLRYKRPWKEIPREFLREVGF